MVQPMLLERAKQGDLDAVAQLMNRSLQAHQVSAKLVRQDRCLKILLQGAVVPPLAIASSLQTGLERLGIPQIDRLEIYAKQSDSTAIAWSKTAQLEPAIEAVTFSRFPVPPAPAEPAVLKVCPRSYLGLAWLTTFLAFLPLGIAALIFARQVQPLHDRQNYEGAKSAAETAKILCIVGICLASPFYLAIGFVAGGYSLLMAAHEQQIDRLAEAQAKTTIEAINRSQQAHWLEHSKFAVSANELQLPLQFSDRYRYQFTAAESDKAIVTATPTRPQLKSFTGIVYAIPSLPLVEANGFVKTSLLQSAICTTSQPIAAGQIHAEGDRIVCPSVDAGEL